VRDFSIAPDSGMRHKGKFLAFTEKNTKNNQGAATGLEYLAALGITHIHLLPAFDFASVNELAAAGGAGAGSAALFNWGYDPQNYNVPEGSYSTAPEVPAARVREFKAMVQALHGAGLRLVMDVVFNHTFQTGAGPFDAITPGYFYRTFADGRLANGSGCGNEVASERPMVRKFIIDSCLFWLREYQVDGFRFDLMGLLDRETMAQLAQKTREAAGADVILYGEPWQAGGSPLAPELQTGIGAQRGLGIAIFNDRIRGAIKGGSDDGSRGFATGAAGAEGGIARGVRGSVDDICDSADESVNYVTAHDNLNLWDKMALSYGAADLAAEPYGLISPERALFDHDVVRSVLLANAIVFTSQGIAFFQAGDEFLRSKFGDANSYKSPDAVNMIRWDNVSRFRAVTDYYRGLIRLRREHPAFRMAARADMDAVKIVQADDLVVAFTIDGRRAGDVWRSLFVAYNGSGHEKRVALPDGVWQVVVDDAQAGTTALRTAEGAYALPRISAFVAYQL
jgi:pullulanase